jgi:transcriptional regulator with XRE-family HTH domain
MTDKPRTDKSASPVLDQNPHALEGARENSLEASIGRQVREFRIKLNMTVVDLARQADLSAGMLSKIENGMTSPSLGTLQGLSRALNVPVTAFFRKFEESRDATYVAAGQGLAIERRGTRSGHQYQLLGHSIGNKDIVLEPYLVTLSEKSDVFPVFQHSGQEFIYLLEGEMTYRHGAKLYPMKAGDSLFFDADAPHGPEELHKLPIRLLSVIVYPRGTAD